jgi:hypothetical protein
MRPKYDLARRCFDLAYESSQTCDPELRSVIQLNLVKFDCLHGTPNSMQAKIKSIFMKKLMTESTRSEFQLLEAIKMFRKHLMETYTPLTWQNYDSLYASPTTLISPELRMEADSLRCYPWIKNSTIGQHGLDKLQCENLLDELAKNSHSSHSVRVRIRLLKALRHDTVNDTDLTFHETYNILSDACTNECLFLEERILAKTRLLFARLSKRVDDSVITLKKCLEFGDEISGSEYFQHHFYNYFHVLPHLKAFEMGYRQPNDLIHKLIYNIFASENSVINPNAILRQYAQICSVKLNNEGGRFQTSFIGAVWILEDVIQNPATNNYWILNINDIVADARKLLTKFNWLKAEGFAYLSEDYQLEILKLRVEDTAELRQMVRFSLAEQYFQFSLSYQPLTYEKAIKFLKDIAVTPIDYDESARIRWQLRNIKAKRIIEENLNHGDCLLQ